MGKRSRTRSRTTPPPPVAKGRPGQKAAAKAPAPRTRPPRKREGAFDRLSPVRRTLAIYLGCAMLLSISTVLGIAILGGTLGPLIVLAYVILGAGLAFRWAQERLRGQTMSDEDRVMQTMAGGLLLISTGLAAVSALVLTLA